MQKKFFVKSQVDIYDQIFFKFYLKKQQKMRLNKHKEQEYEFIKIRTFQKVPALLSVGGLAMATLLALAQRVKTHSDNFAGL